MSRATVILCPLAFEAAHARRAVRGLDAEVRVTGPGGLAVRRGVDAARGAGGPEGGVRGLVLFGTCGALVQTARVPRVARVRDRSGRVWGVEGGKMSGLGEVPARSAEGPGAGVTVLGVERPAIAPGEKAMLRAQSGAELVDCESHAFAEACALAGVGWRIVRAVSDGPEEALPRGVEGWVGPDGRTRVGRVIWACVRSPRLIGEVIRLGRRSGAALREAEGALRAAVDELRRAGAMDVDRIGGARAGAKAGAGAAA